jgi:DNA invertase Pin-like site-specific DNA recombinase
MKGGYARVSNKYQDFSLQIDSMEDVGCTRIYKEQVSGTNKDRIELQKMLKQLREGDVIFIWKLDRLARSLKDLIGLVKEIQDKGA